MSSPADKMPHPSTPEYKALSLELASDYAAMARRDAARLLKAELHLLAAESPLHYEELRNAVISFEAEMLNEENPEAARALGF